MHNLNSIKAAKIASNYIKPANSFSKESVFDASRKMLCDNFRSEKIDKDTFEKAIDQLGNLIFKSGLAEPEVLMKSGEGSRGGHIIGHTRNGKPIYSSFEHHDFRGHSKFNNPDDHMDAAMTHGYARNRVREKIIQEHGHDKAKVVDKMSSDKDVAHHDEQRQKHLDAYASSIATEKKFKEKTIEKVKNATTEKELSDIHTVVNHHSIGWSDDSRRHINDHISLRAREISNK